MEAKRQLDNSSKWQRIFWVAQFVASLKIIEAAWVRYSSHGFPHPLAEVILACAPVPFNLAMAYHGMFAVGEDSDTWSKGSKVDSSRLMDDGADPDAESVWNAWLDYRPPTSESPDPTVAAMSSPPTSNRGQKDARGRMNPFHEVYVTVPSWIEDARRGRAVVKYAVKLKARNFTVRPRIFELSSNMPVAGQQITIWRRYSEFRQFRRSIKAIARAYGVRLPQFPKKQLHPNLEQRRVGLEKFLQQLCEIPALWRAVGQFVGLVGGSAASLVPSLSSDSGVSEVYSTNSSGANSRAGTPNPEMSSDSDIPEARSEPAGSEFLGASSLSREASGAFSASGNQQTSSSNYTWEFVGIDIEKWEQWHVSGSGATNTPNTRSPGPAFDSERPNAASPDAVEAKDEVPQVHPSPDLPSSFVTLTLRIRTTHSQYSTVKTLDQIVRFRRILVRHVFLNSNVQVPPLPIIDSLSDSDLDNNALSVEIFLQKLVNTPLFRCDDLYAFLDSPELVTVYSAIGLHRLSPFDSPATLLDHSERVKSSEAWLSPSAIPPSGGSLQYDTKVMSSPSARPPTNALHDMSSYGDNSPPTSAAAMSGENCSGAPLALGAGMSQRDSFHRFSVDIPDMRRSDPSDPKSYMLFTIAIREYYSLHSYIEWAVLRRYSEFERFHRTLANKFQHLPSLPGKKFGTHTAEFLTSRRKALAIYLQQVINTSHYQGDDLYKFVELNNPERSIQAGQDIY
jgi:PX domain